MKKRNWKSMKVVSNPYVVCGLLALFGVLLVVVAAIDYKDPWGWWTSWGSNVVNSIATTLIASAVVSIVLEMSNLRDFVIKALENVLGDDFPLSAYSEENLINFLYGIVAETLNRKLTKGNLTKEKLKNSIYSLEKQMRDNVTDIHYEYHKLKYSITPDEKNGVFKVESHLEYKIVNEYGKNNEIVFKTKTYYVSSDMSKEPGFEPFVIEKFNINDKPVTEYQFEKSPIEQSSAKYYDYKVAIRKELPSTVKYHKVQLHYVYYCPMYDTTQAYKVQYPCKRVEHRFRIYPDCTTKKLWFLHADGFTAYFCSQTTQDKYCIEQNEDDVVKIDFKDWVFPGSGYVVSIQKKEN